MYRRDLITAEIQKLAQVLARIMGLKSEGKTKDADNLFIESLTADFGISSEELLTTSASDFEQLLSGKAFPFEKLEMLSQFLYDQFDPANNNPENHSFAQKLQLIYQLLESKYHIVNMINLDRKKKVQQYLKT